MWRFRRSCFGGRSASAAPRAYVEDRQLLPSKFSGATKFVLDRITPAHHVNTFSAALGTDAVSSEVVGKATGTPCVELSLTPLPCVQEIEVGLGGYQPALTAHKSLVFRHAPTVTPLLSGQLPDMLLNAALPSRGANRGRGILVEIKWPAEEGADQALLNRAPWLASASR
jgi:hypothetical protein